MAESSFKQVENIVGKGEIAHYEQFLLFPQCFQKTCTAGVVWERVNMFHGNIYFSLQGAIMHDLELSRDKAVEKLKETRGKVRLKSKLELQESYHALTSIE